MALILSWPFPVHAFTSEDVNVSCRVRIISVPRQSRARKVQIDIVIQKQLEIVSDCTSAEIYVEFCMRNSRLHAVHQ